MYTALRAHEVGRITQGLGVITFPSYHVFFALNLTWAARSIKPVFLFLIALNIVNILSTMTTGWHYFVDVVAGFVLFALALALVSSVEKRMRTSADS